MFNPAAYLIQGTMTQRTWTFALVACRAALAATGGPRGNVSAETPLAGLRVPVT